MLWNEAGVDLPSLGKSNGWPVQTMLSLYYLNYPPVTTPEKKRSRWWSRSTPGEPNLDLCMRLQASKHRFHEGVVPAETRGAIRQSVTAALTEESGVRHCRCWAPPRHHRQMCTLAQETNTERRALVKPHTISLTHTERLCRTLGAQRAFT